MTNYNNGKIYKIEPLNGEDGDIYIGSTTKEYLSQRMTAHRYGYNKFLKGKGYKVMSYILFQKYGIENCNIILLELVSVNTKDELHAREAHYIKSLTCVNKCIPLQTTKEWRDANKDKIKDYREATKDKAKEYREANRDTILIKIKEWRDANKDTILIKNKEYREANKDKIKEWRDANKDYQKQYQDTNKDKINERKRELIKIKKQQLTV